jgi:hypothetical protein
LALLLGDTGLQSAENAAATETVERFTKIGGDESSIVVFRTKKDLGALLPELHHLLGEPWRSGGTRS